MPTYVTRQMASDGVNAADVLRSILRFQAKSAVAATGLTDSSTGAASGTNVVAAPSAAAVATAATGSNLADKTTTEAAMVTVQNSLATLYAKANAAATALGLPTVTYNGGGTSGGNTVAAQTKSVTGAATGVPAAAYNAFVAGANAGYYNLAVLVNRLAVAAGATSLNVDALKGAAVASTVAAIPVATGTAASPGVLKSVADADLNSYANNTATVAAAITAIVAGVNKPGAIAA